MQLSSKSYRRPRHKLFDLPAFAILNYERHPQRKDEWSKHTYPALVAMSLVPDWRKRGDEKDQGQSNLLLTHISPFFAVNHIAHLKCFHVLLCVVITCSYIVLDKKVKNQRNSDHIRAERIIFSISQFETRGN